MKLGISCMTWLVSSSKELKESPVITVVLTSSFRFHPQRNWKLSENSIDSRSSLFSFILKGIESSIMTLSNLCSHSCFILKGIERFCSQFSNSSKPILFHPQRNWKSSQQLELTTASRVSSSKELKVNFLSFYPSFSNFFVSSSKELKVQDTYI